MTSPQIRGFAVILGAELRASFWGILKSFWLNSPTKVVALYTVSCNH